MGDFGAVIVAAASVLGVIGLVGAGLVYMRSSYVKERDAVRADTISGLRDLASTQEAICDAEKAERDAWIARLEQHHQRAHARCNTVPVRDA